MKIYLLQLVILMSLSLNLQAQNLSGTIRGKVTVSYTHLTLPTN